MGSERAIRMRKWMMLFALWALAVPAQDGLEMFDGVDIWNSDIQIRNNGETDGTEPGRWV